MTTTYRAGKGTASHEFRLAGTRRGSRLPQHDRPGAAASLAPVRGSSVTRADLLRAVAALLERIADNAAGDPDPAQEYHPEPDPEPDPGPAQPDHVLIPALVHAALGWHEPGAGRTPAQAARPGEPLTHSETRVLRYLPTHMSALEIAAELYLSPNTVKTHLRHLYQKLGARSRHQAVQRAWAIGLLTQPAPVGDTR